MAAAGGAGIEHVGVGAAAQVAVGLALAAGAAGFSAGGFQLLLKAFVKPDGKQRFLHDLYCDLPGLLAWQSTNLWSCQHEGHALQVARATRITVSDVLEYLAGGMSQDKILSDFPDLRPEHIQAVLRYAAERKKRLSELTVA
ncbi:DUF433 domain-containing protein [Cyanobium sp. Cruz CV11-17]|uniref:DUF433 domain-containing protein n=1 Tax=Cyanobium sp. Cruz CV11-17 TaxID=2823709 RepID=UPI0020CFE16E|nr:DUF433 domain-containing protein [Cyanobium sp. Cruz CV11-17]